MAPIPEVRGCLPQRPVDRLVTTPQTVQSFMDQLALLGRVRVLTLVTLVTATMGAPARVRRVLGTIARAHPAVLRPAT